MEIAIIGLGRMGSNMAKRLLKEQHRVVVYDPSPDAGKKLAEHHAVVARNIAECKGLLKGPRVAWVMVPHGAATDSVITQLSQSFEEGDIIIDGGNSHFLESIERKKSLAARGIDFVDVGVSGGVFGLERGYCLMIGGESTVVSHLEPIFKTLAPGMNAATTTKSRTHNYSSAHEGYYHCGPSGAGHYVKMIHNAIEYGMMQSYAEGLEILSSANAENLPEAQRYDFDLREICEVWRRGSVVNSWLLDLLADAFHKSPKLSEFSGMVPDSGEGRWAMMEAIKQGTPSPNLANSLFTRFRSRQNQPMAEKSLSALRKEFGGHSEVVVEPKK